MKNMKFNLVNKVIDFLKQNTGQRFTAREIAQWIFDNYPDECSAKRNRSKATINTLESDDALIRQITAEICSYRASMQRGNAPKLRRQKSYLKDTTSPIKQIRLRLKKQRRLMNYLRPKVI